jgi:chromosome segregation ATPase
VKVQASEDLQSEIRFQLEEAVRARQQLEADLAAARQKFEAERNVLKAQINGMQASAVDAMERSNNPSRLAVAVNEKLEARLAEAKQEWQLQWNSERRRFEAEIDRLKKMASPGAIDEKREAARRAVLEKLGKLRPGSAGPAARTADQWEREFQDAKTAWDAEREQLHVKIKKLELELQRVQDSMRNDVFQEMRAQYEPKLAEANRERQRLEREIQSITNDVTMERNRLTARIEQLEKAAPEAQQAARKQAVAELQIEFDAKLEEANRLLSRQERKQQDAADEWEAEMRRAKKQIAALEEQLREAKEAAYKAQKATPRNS